MCTVTVIRNGAFVRLACNRDEQRTRPAAVRPQVISFGCRHAVVPIDPCSGGTWIGASDAGLGLTLLNVNAPVAAAGSGARSRSRGTIIAELLACATLAEAVSRGLALNAATFAPFRLVVVDCHDVAELRSDGSQVQLARRAPLAQALLFTSSGLGDHLVQEPRQQLFDELFGGTADPLVGQDAFHRHHWPERPHLSVCMRRADAHTVSHTVITLAPHTVTLDYHPAAPDMPADPSSVVLQRRAGGAA
jgi:hypothetical protein